MAASRFAADGVAVVHSVVPGSALASLRGLRDFSVGGRAGHRSFLVPQAVAELIAPGGTLTELASTLVGAPTRPVRILYFDKRPGANWAVAWHQDRTIAVARRVDVAGFGPWSLKSGMPHVEPPESILFSIVTLRLHVDDCGRDNGPLLALRGSYRLGRIIANEIHRHIEQDAVEVCVSRAGDVVAMRGLTIHASERASQPSHRRVIHVDFSSAELPGALEWAMDHPAG
jgi:hypothetical protein